MINSASLEDEREGGMEEIELTLRPQEGKGAGRKGRRAGSARPRMYFPLSFICFNSFGRLGRRRGGSRTMTA